MTIIYDLKAQTFSFIICIPITGSIVNVNVFWFSNRTKGSYPFSLLMLKYDCIFFSGKTLISFVGFSMSIYKTVKTQHRRYNEFIHLEDLLNSFIFSLRLLFVVRNINANANYQLIFFLF